MSAYSVGSTVYAIWEDDRYAIHHGSAVVEGSSRSKRRLTDDEVEAALGGPPQLRQIWRRVRKGDEMHFDVCGCEWHTEGTGEGWLRVALRDPDASDGEAPQ